MQQTLIRYWHRWSSAAKVEDMWQGTGTYDRLTSSLIAAVASGSTHGPLLASWPTPLLSRCQHLLLFSQWFFLVTLWGDSRSFLAQNHHFSSVQPVWASHVWGGTLLTLPQGHGLNDLSGVCAPFVILAPQSVGMLACQFNFYTSWACHPLLSNAFTIDPADISPCLNSGDKELLIGLFVSRNIP